MEHLQKKNKKKNTSLQEKAIDKIGVHYFYVMKTQLHC